MANKASMVITALVFMRKAEEKKEKKNRREREKQFMRNVRLINWGQDPLHL